VASMADEPRENGAIPARRMTVEEYQRLEEIGVLGEQVELIEGQILFGRYPFMFSGEAVAAAREAGIELAAATRTTPSRSKPPRKKSSRTCSTSGTSRSSTLPTRPRRSATQLDAANRSLRRTSTTTAPESGQAPLSSAAYTQAGIAPAAPRQRLPAGRQRRGGPSRCERPGRAGRPRRSESFTENSPGGDGGN
jgi:hypothetical protein